MNVQTIENVLWVLVVLGAVYFIFRYFKSAGWRLRKRVVRMEPSEESRRLHVQACERLLLLVRRSEFSSMVLRTIVSGMKVSDLQSCMSRQLREEWEHNAVQQLYVSDQVWSSVEEFIQAQTLQIHRKSAECNPMDDAEVLATLLLTDIALEQELAKNAKDLIKKEVKLWMES